MTLEYDLDLRLKELIIVLDEYTEWCMQVVRRICYPSSSEGDTQFSKPVSYLNWAEKAGEDRFKPEILSRLNNLHDDLSAQVDSAINNVMKFSRPASYDEFNKVVTLFEEFLYHIRRVEWDLMLEDSGLDPLTGLRSAATLEKDISREMDRLARQGKPFSLALVRIDCLDEIKTSNNSDVAYGHIRVVSDMIKRSMRSYDDAYRLENDEFALSLKQSSMNGGIKALERLKRELEKANIFCNINGKKVPLTLSSCIAEPVPGDDVRALLFNLRADLDSSAKTGGTVLEYFEMSPLQRYARESGD